GDIELDTDVSDYIPFDLVNPIHPDISITPRMLLSHRSGLGVYLPYEFCYDWNGEPFADYTIGYSTSVVNVTLAEYLSECLVPGGEHYSNENWLSWEPGTEHSYANSGFKVLMCLLETVTGQSISEYMQENIFTPLRLNNTGFNATALDMPQATPYTRINGTNHALPIWNGLYMMRSSICDMGNLLIALMNMGEFDGHQLLQPETVAMMMNNTNSNLPPLNLKREPQREGYGFGLDIFSHALYGHGGSTIGFTADSYFNPTMKRGYVKLSNVNSILIPGTEEWRSIYDTTQKVKLLVLTHVGLIPPFYILEVFIFLCVGVCCVGIVSTIIRKRRKVIGSSDLIVS
ncbi:MAG: serine hydrolase domain-containing protein, partial [Candidatus Thorarchaeota archaeon]